MQLIIFIRILQPSKIRKATNKKVSSISTSEFDGEFFSHNHEEMKLSILSLGGAIIAIMAEMSFVECAYSRLYRIKNNEAVRSSLSSGRRY